MTTKRLNGTGGNRINQDRTRTGRTDKKEKVGRPDSKRLTIESPATDQFFADAKVASVESPLTALVWQGINELAKQNNWVGPDANPIAKLFSALGPTERPDVTYLKDQRNQTRRQFVSLGFNTNQAGNLVDLLAFVAGGFTDPMAKRKARENFIQHEIDSVRTAIGDILKKPLRDRDAPFAKLMQGLKERTEAVERRTEHLTGKELPEPLNVVVERLRAVNAIASIIAAHVLPQKPEAT
jgi:hypothetical protein